MYRWLLCWRYLKTRYIALASVISVMLGVATLIIVNSVMDGFTTEMQDRMHGILSDVVIESHTADGLANHDVIEAQIRELVGDQLEGLTTVVHVPAMVNIEHQGESITRQINLIGIDEKTYANVSDFSKYLLHPENRDQISFDLRNGGYAPDRDFPDSGWPYRKAKAQRRKRLVELMERNERLSRSIEQANQTGSALPAVGPSLASEQLLPSSGIAGNAEASAQPSPTDTPAGTENQLAFPETPASLTASAAPAQGGTESAPSNGPAFDQHLSEEEEAASKFDAETEQWAGIVLGISIGSTRYRHNEEVIDYYYVQPGDDVRVTFPTAGSMPTAVHESFTVVDFYESKMSEYDATFAFVPLERLQEARGMVNNEISSIQLRLKAGVDLDLVRDLLRAKFPPETGLQVSTWRDMQGALLAAVQMETTILNILLFLIIAVAGFGILATFFMIVVEKTKDIGILKSLGASGRGVAAIFLGYGVLLGTFGAGVGAIAGLVFVAYINSIADLLEVVTGQEVFDPTVYYFDTIPTIVHPSMVFWVIVGAVLIAVLASVLPSLRAARMHPVRALRYE
ncbi:MAG: ABC transporter permease [Aureliella sp.]